ncbi:MAG: 4Fe-4S binding protein [Oscillospiraceae bacterium]|jgi:carbon-monoxide dehydrogenase iron sulfur subunit|nr:4Fe-4S binding protein [Oscillospiraceae bacterium]
MKKIYVREEWCLGCHLCEYYCANANLGNGDMAKTLKGAAICPCIRVEEDDRISFAVPCRHCEEPHCKKSCITGAISVEGGVVRVDKDKCVGCFTCVLACPYGAVMPSADGHAVQKCELCLQNNTGGAPACVAHCPNRAIIFEEEAEVASA